MKKIIFGLLVLSSLAITNSSYARGGDSFLGGFAGGTMGSMVGTSIASRPSCGSGYSDDSGRRALRAVDRLEDMMRNDFKTLNNKITKLERKVARLEGERDQRSTQKKISVAQPEKEIGKKAPNRVVE